MRALLLILLTSLLTLVAFPASATYTKIANNGAELSDSTSLGSGLTTGDVSTTTTGLTWEVKTAG